MRHWHARIGVLIAAFLLLLSITGLALSHTGSLGLDKRQVSTGWLMHWYGLKASVPTHGFLLKGGYIAADNGRWVMNGKVLHEANGTPLGAVSWGEMRGLVSTDILYLYMADGRLVDKLAGSSLPAWPIKRIGIIADKLALDTAQGIFVTSDGLSWLPLKNAQLQWSTEQSLPDSIALRQAFAPTLSLERIVLDLHSGRIFGHYGPRVMDISAVVLLMLAMSGLWIYLRTLGRTH